MVGSRRRRRRRYRDLGAGHRRRCILYCILLILRVATVLHIGWVSTWMTYFVMRGHWDQKI